MTEMTRRVRLLAGLLAIAAAIAGLTSQPSRAQLPVADPQGQAAQDEERPPLTFDPSVSVERVYTSDLGVSETDETSASYYRLLIALPVERNWSGGSLRFLYSPFFESFDEFSELDNTGHHLNASLRAEPGVRSNVNASLAYDRTEDRGDPIGLGSADLFPTPRIERQVATAAASYSRRVARLWSWEASAGLSDLRFDAVEDGDPIGGLLDDRQELGAGLAVRKELTREVSIGAGYGYQFFDLETPGDETLHSLSVLARRRHGEDLTIEASLGYFRGSSETTTPADPAAPDDERDGVQGGLSLVRTYRRYELVFGADRRPTSGGASFDTATDSSVHLAISGALAARWNGTLGARWAQRDPRSPLLATTESLGGAAGLALRVHRQAELALSVDYAELSESGGGAPLPAFAPGSYYEVRLGMAWHPFGGTRLAGAPVERAGRG